MIYECTDCENCASFSFGYRVFCLHSKLPSHEVCKYFPVGEWNAERCQYFDEGEPHHFGDKSLRDAEIYTEQNKILDPEGFPNYYEGIRRWCLEQLKR